MSDLLHRFLMQDAPVRGELVCLESAWHEIASRHDLPQCVRDRLGELCVAGLMLAASLKFDGALVLQIQGDGPVSLMVVECESDGRLRATAKVREGQVCPEQASLNDLVNRTGKGRFMVTLDPRKSTVQRQAYQGIVPFEGDTIAEVLERYMARSEQLPTRLWLSCDSRRAAGLMLQRLPDEGGTAKPLPSAPEPTAATPAGAAQAATQDPHDEAWQRMLYLADTVTGEELRNLPAEQMLHRLFWQESLHAFDARAVRFACSCSRQKVGDMLRMLGRQEVESILAEQWSVAVRCDFCHTAWTFDAVDSAELFLGDTASVPGPSTRH
ncbi:MAG: Hsp33 family molecular chaperone HslO [Burkholderiales bacterium]